MFYLFVSFYSVFVSSSRNVFVSVVPSGNVCFPMHGLWCSIMFSLFRQFCYILYLPFSPICPVFFYSVLFCCVLFCSVLFCSVLFCLSCFVLFWFVPLCFILCRGIVLLCALINLIRPCQEWGKPQVNSRGGREDAGWDDGRGEGGKEEMEKKPPVCHALRVSLAVDESNHSGMSSHSFRQLDASQRHLTTSLRV